MTPALMSPHSINTNKFGDYLSPNPINTNDLGFMSPMVMAKPNLMMGYP